MLINIKLKQFCFRTSIVKTNYNFSYQSTLNSFASVVTQLTYKLPQCPSVPGEQLASFVTQLTLKLPSADSVPGQQLSFCCHTADIQTPRAR